MDHFKEYERLSKKFVRLRDIITAKQVEIFQLNISPINSSYLDLLLTRLKNLILQYDMTWHEMKEMLGFTDYQMSIFDFEKLKYKDFTDGKNL